MVFVFTVKPGLVLPRLQTYIFPRVSRLSCTASFTLHIEDGQGAWPPGLTPTLPNIYAGPTHLFTPWSGQSSVTFGSL